MESKSVKPARKVTIISDGNAELRPRFWAGQSVEARRLLSDCFSSKRQRHRPDHKPRKFAIFDWRLAIEINPKSAVVPNSKSSRAAKAVVGKKILCPLWTCGFDSRPKHHLYLSLDVQMSTNIGISGLLFCFRNFLFVVLCRLMLLFVFIVVKKWSRIWQTLNGIQKLF